MDKDNKKEPEEEEYDPHEFERQLKRGMRESWERDRDELKQGQIGASLKKGNILEDIALSLRTVSYFLERIAEEVRYMK